MSRILMTGVALGLLLSGSVVAQQAPYSQPFPPGDAAGQPQGAPPYGPDAGQPPGYPAPPGQPPGYPPPPAYGAPAYAGQPFVGPDGLTYLNGVPVYYAYGSYLPLVFVAGFGWGYYGPGHQWFGAPPVLIGRLDHFYPGGRGFPGHFGHGFARPGFRGPDRDGHR